MFLFYVLLGCEKEHIDETGLSFEPLLYQDSVLAGAEGGAGQHTQVVINSINNPLGYYEYLPEDFEPSSKGIPLIIYWNGQNAGAGDGDKDLPRLLTQGLPQLIHKGSHYPAIILSPMTEFKAWKSLDVDPFVDFAKKKYAPYISKNKVYMTGFSAGGGLTMRYAIKYPNELAAIVPVSPAIPLPNEDQLNGGIKSLPSWIFHNSGDSVVTSDRSEAWHKELSDASSQHHLTIYPSDSHYAWQAAYAEKEMWTWLFNQTR